MWVFFSPVAIELRIISFVGGIKDNMKDLILLVETLHCTILLLEQKIKLKYFLRNNMRHILTLK